MVAFRSGPRPSGKEAREAVEKLKSKTKIGKGRKIIKEDPNQDIKIKSVPGFRSGGRAMYKSGSKGCKLAMKGKGRAYGKNS